MLEVERMRIPVFVSCPSLLNPEQEKSAQFIKSLIDKNKLVWRALGKSDYSLQFPLTEVLGMVRHCSGGIILGFRQFEAPSGIFKAGTEKEEVQNGPVYMPTPWNHLEAGILFNQKLPILIFREKGITGGIFDIGTQDQVFIHEMPKLPLKAQTEDDLDTLFQNWAAQVKTHYYQR
jgi:hypothetical protein